MSHGPRPPKRHGAREVNDEELIKSPELLHTRIGTLCGLTGFPKLGEGEWVGAKKAAKNKVRTVDQEGTGVVSRNKSQDLAGDLDLGADNNHGGQEAGNQ